MGSEIARALSEIARRHAELVVGIHGHNFHEVHVKICSQSGNTTKKRPFAMLLDA